MELKRLPLKYIRDRAKSAYKKDKECRICFKTGEEVRLDFHHFHTLDHLLLKWVKEKDYSVKTVEDIMSIRDEFIEDHYTELYEEAVTLCNPHHKMLHKIYGVKPALITAPKQKRWVEIQREKHLAKRNS